MFICISAMGVPGNDDPGYGIFEFDQAKALASIYNKVVYAALDTRSFKHRRKYGFSKYQDENVLVYSLNIPLGGIPSRYNNGFFALIYGKLQLFLFNYLMRKVINEEGAPDIFHSHFLDVSSYTAKYCRLHNYPLVITEHWSLLNKENVPEYIVERAKVTYKFSSARLCVSTAFAKQLFRVTGYDFKVIPNIVSTDDFFYQPSNHKSESFSFVSCGSLGYGKGHDVLIRAFRKVHDAYHNCELKIIGGGGDLEKLRELVYSLSLQGCVSFCGVLQRNKIRELFNNSDVFVLASRGETFGVVYIEAMATGLPVIATLCGGPEDFVTQENGLLVPRDDVDSLSNAMMTMIERNKEYDKEDIAMTTKTLFSPGRIADQLMLVYSSVLNISVH